MLIVKGPDRILRVRSDRKGFCRSITHKAAHPGCKYHYGYRHQHAQFLVDKRKQFLGGLSISFLNAFQDLDHIAHVIEFLAFNVESQASNSGKYKKNGGN